VAFVKNLSNAFHKTIILYLKGMNNSVMRNFLILLMLLALSSPLLSQINLVVDGHTYSSGYDVPHSSPTTLTFTNNSFTGSYSEGYQLDAGDETSQSSNNNLDGAVITGNRFIWNGTDPSATMHALFTGYNKNVTVKYNYLYRPPLGIIRKSSGMTNTSGGVAYNIIVDPIVGVIAKGMNNVRIYNNTFYSTKSIAETWHGMIDVYMNNDEGQGALSTNTKIFNNIFYTEQQRVNIYVYEAACLSGFESDYNVYYCASGGPRFQVAGNIYNFSQWQSLGYDAHSVVVNPGFIDLTSFVPSARLDYGTDLGSDWITGLAVDAVWGTTAPSKTDQNGTWQVGARIYGSETVPVTSISVSAAGGLTTVPVGNTLQLSASVLPANATDKSVIWTITNGTGQATISSSGLVTGTAVGTVTARATAHDGSGKYGTLALTITSQSVPVTTINVNGAGGLSTITTDNGTLQLIATVLPANASNPAVTWSVTDGTGHATINSSGLVSAVSNGTVTATATAADGTGVTGALVITISNQTIPVTGITVTGAGGATTISTDNGTLQLTATVSPSNATNKAVNWTVTNGTGQATINSSGLLSAVSNGTVTARATATDGTGIYGTLIIMISGQIVPVTSISVTGAGGATIITTDNGTLQLTATVLPSGATNKTVTWSVVNGSGQATINSSGLVTAVLNGNVMAIASATDGSGITGSLVITISSQIIPVTSVTVTGAGGATTISTDNGTLQMSADVQPANATSKNVTWSVTSGTGNASINATGMLSAISNGTVTVTASSTDGSGVTGTRVITISGQVVSVSSVSVSGEGGATAIFNDHGTLQLYADVQPDYATNKTITWSIENGTGEAEISAAGLVSAISNGTVTAKASAADGSGIYGTLRITISGQILLVSGITVTSLSGISTINTFNGSLQLQADILPTDATNKSVIWSVNNVTGAASISANGVITASSNGLVTATASSTDGSGITGMMDITIDMSSDKQYTVIVNTDEIRLTFLEDFTAWTVNLYDFMGNVVGKKRVDSNIITFNRRHSAPGLYLIVLSNNDKLYVEKVMVL
jgi:uncharacterized protein YjdB